MGEADNSGVLVDVRDAQLYVEDSGNGTPIVLLHGGLFSLEGWRPIMAPLQEHHRVIAVDSRGQGGSTAGDGPLTYGRMAFDIVRVLDVLDLDRAHIVGHSDGGCIALHLLTDHPDRLSSVTLIGTPLHHDDYRPGSDVALAALVDGMKPGSQDYLATHYDSLSPHPERRQEVAERLGATWRTEPMFSDAALALVQVPVLVIGVDGDEFVAREVFERTGKVFPNGEVTWIENGTHAVPMPHSDAVADAITSFVAQH